MHLDSSPDIAAVSDGDSIVDSSSHVELSEFEWGIWLDHPKIADDGNCDFDLVLPVGPNVADLVISS